MSQQAERRARPLQPRVRQPETAELREWANRNGFAVGDRGRLPEEVQAAWGERQSAN